jgi:hypothetical protein
LIFLLFLIFFIIFIFKFKKVFIVFKNLRRFFVKLFKFLLKNKNIIKGFIGNIVTKCYSPNSKPSFDSESELELILDKLKKIGCTLDKFEKNKSINSNNLKFLYNCNLIKYFESNYRSDPRINFIFKELKKLGYDLKKNRKMCLY